MARYIDADIAMRMIENDYTLQVHYTKKDAIECIECTRTADVQEINHGKWVHENYECSFCGESLRSIMDSDSYFSGDFNGCNYCPECGAKIDLCDECQKKLENVIKVGEFK